MVRSLAPVRLLAVLLLLLASGPLLAQPALGPGRPITEGVEVHTVELDRDGVRMTVWIYVPRGLEGPLPVVLIAPAGTPLVHGMVLGDGDRPEQIPYARAGFVVVGYSLDGPVEEGADDATFLAAIRSFLAADGGIANARAALDYCLEAVDLADARRIYTVGHSSAATLALQVAAADERVSGAIAYAPVTDLVGRVSGDWLDQVAKDVPGVPAFLEKFSPLENVGRVACPVLLFHAADDGNVPIDETRTYARRLREAGGEADRVTLLETPAGGHYESMMALGIPAGIDWLRARSGHVADPTRPRPDDAVALTGERIEGRLPAGRAILYRLDATAETGGLTELVTGGGVDTFLRVYDGAGQEVLSENDDVDGENLASRLVFHAEPGRSYLIKISGYMDSAGDVVLGRRVLVAGGVGARASAEIPDEAIAIESLADRVFEWVAPWTGTLVLSTEAADEETDPVLLVYDDQGGLLALDDDASPTTVDCRIALEVEEGKKYLIQVMGYAGNAARVRLVATRG